MTKGEEIAEIAILTEICKLIESTNNPDDVLSPVLMMLFDLYNAEDAAFGLFDTKKNEIYVDVSLGLSDTEQMRGRYKPGEGITGTVFKTGKLKIVPKTTLEPNFLNKAKSRSKQEECSFICIPIKYDSIVTGTLSVTLPWKENLNLEYIARFMNIVATIIAQPLVLKHQLREIEYKNLKDKEQRNQYIPFIGNSSIIRELKIKLHEYAKKDAPLLFVGDNGTGKTFTAHTLHAMSLRKSDPLIRCNTHTIAQHEIISSIFGDAIPTPPSHYKREKTTAIPLIKQADNTTLLIEEAHLLPKDAQKTLYNILQTNEISINGSVQKSYARILLTITKKTLEDAIAALDEDLYKILSRHILRIPLLKERKDDITMLADHFLQEASKKQHRNVRRFSTPTIDLLYSYHWPGNLNEMQQVIEHSVRICEGGVIHTHMLPPSLQSAESTNTIEKQGLLETVATVEKDLIIDTLKLTHGNMKKAAKVLKISQRIFGLRVKKYNIKPFQYR